MRRIATCAAALLMVVASGPAYAQGAPGGRPAQAGPKAKPAAANTGAARSAAAKAPKVKAPKAKGPKVATSGSPAAAATATSSAAGRGKANAPGQMKKNAQATADGTAMTGANVPRNPELQARLQAMLPEGMALDEAAAGFKNQGQFIAAVHASNRLDVAFQDLKVKMVDEGASLGQAIQVLKPGVDAEVEASAAQVQADQDLK